MPLSKARAGEVVELVDVRGGADLRRRLAEMGLGTGSRLTVETDGRRGPCIVQVLGSRVILGHGMVSRMLVHPVPQAGGPRE
jgi:Fe2+ transport system protein FeoA